MQRLTESKKYPLNDNEIDFICTCAEKLRRREKHRLMSNTNQRRAEYSFIDHQAFTSNLKSALLYPDRVDTSELADLLDCLGSHDKLRLLNMRPTLVKDCADLALLLRDHVPKHDQFIFACSQADKIFDNDPHVRHGNIVMIVNTLPLRERENFYRFIATRLLSNLEKQVNGLQTVMENLPSHTTEIGRAHV
jgi:hypothetical protein